MSIVDIINSYEEVKDDLKFQSMSSVRIKILIGLSEGPKRIEDLTELTGMKSSGIIYCMKKLEKKNLILNKKNYYHLSKIVHKIASELIDMIKTMIVLKNSQKLWLDHEIESIPYDLLMKIGDLSNSKLMESENEDLSKTHRIHAQVVLNAEKIKGVSPIFYPDYLDTFNVILNKNVEVELVLTENILKKTIESHEPESLERLKRLITEKQVKLWEIKEDVKVAFTVTDKALTLGLSSKKGMYDPVKLLVSDHDDALKWGNKLFDHYLKKARKVDLEYLNIEKTTS